MKIPFKQYWDLLARHIRPQKVRFALLIVLMLVSIVLQVVNPQIIRIFIDAATTGVATRALFLAALRLTRYAPRWPATVSTWI
jgi:ATP-binding cassette subfamily B protein